MPSTDKLAFTAKRLHGGARTTAVSDLPGGFFIQQTRKHGELPMAVNPEATPESGTVPRETQTGT